MEKGKKKKLLLKSDCKNYGGRETQAGLLSLDGALMCEDEDRGHSKWR